MKLGYLGLGKMGKNHVMRLKEKGYEIVAWNRSGSDEIETVGSIKEVVDALETPRVIWIMVTHTGVDGILEELTPLLLKGDIVIDGGNSNYKDTMRRGKMFEEKGIHFVDAGVSGGPRGAREGACIMYGGEKEVVEKLEGLFKDSSAPDAYQYMGSVGAGHFTKMVHNGIEYGMMQALAEGFNLLKNADFGIQLKDAARIYNNKSVIESRLTAWAEDGFSMYGEELEEVSGTVAHTGEGKWTVEAAHEYNQPAPIIEGSFQFRVDSENNPSYIGKVLSMLRNMFGGHSIK